MRAESFDEDAARLGEGIPTLLRPLLPQNLTAGQLDRRGELLEPFVLRWVMQELHAQGGPVGAAAAAAA
jgi:hypothetical protein